MLTGEGQGKGSVRYDVVSTLSESQVVDLIELYRREWWCHDRQIADVRTMLAGTDVVFGVVERGTDRLVAFSRVLTDGVYKALIFDVIVDESHRGTGLARRLMDAILEHPRLKGVKHVELYCRPNLIPFYRQFGFTEDLGALTFMRLER